MTFGLSENLFFRRKKRLEGKEKDYYGYDIPEETRWKIVHILLPDLISNAEVKGIVKGLAKEFGRGTISPDRASADDKLREFIINSPTEELLTSIELLLSLKIHNALGYNYGELMQQTQNITTQINKSFKLDKIGYEVVPVGLKDDLRYIIVPIDSKYLYTETIKKTLTLLHDVEFKGPLQEFESALDGYRNEKYDDAILKANRAFESTLKAILTKKSIPSDEKIDKVPALIQKLFDGGFLESALQDAFSKAISVIQSGLPTIRNQPGVAHGQGLDPKSIEKSYAEFALHLAGTYIVFLIERYKES